MTFDITKCKPFDLERALAGNKVVTAGGLEITEIQYFKTLSSGYPVFAVVGGAIQRFSISGDWYYHDSEGKSHLLMAPRTKRFEAWTNVYSWGISGQNYGSESKAKDNAGNEGYIKTIKIETEIEI